MAQRQVTVASSVGLHARPAALFVEAVNRTGLPVTVAKSGGAPIDARSILLVMAMDARFGDELTLAAEGDGADTALDGLVDLLATDLDAAEAHK